MYLFCAIKTVSFPHTHKKAHLKFYTRTYRQTKIAQLGPFGVKLCENVS